MKPHSLFVAFSLFLFASCAFAQDEYAVFTIGKSEYTININPEVIGSMNAGAFILLGPNDGYGMGLTIMIPDESITEYELSGGYEAPMVGIGVSANETYTVETGTLTITAVDNGTYEGTFTGSAKNTSDNLLYEVTGRFKVALDM